jgi:hypothetical protein
MRYTLKEYRRGKDRQGYLQAEADSVKLGMNPIPYVVVAYGINNDSIWSNEWAVCMDVENGGDGGSAELDVDSESSRELTNL